MSSKTKMARRLSHLENEMHVLLTLQTTTDRVTSKKKRALAVRIVKPNAKKDSSQSCYCGDQSSDALRRRREVNATPSSPQFRTPYVRARSVEAARTHGVRPRSAGAEVRHVCVEQESPEPYVSRDLETIPWSCKTTEQQVQEVGDNYQLMQDYEENDKKALLQEEDDDDKPLSASSEGRLDSASVLNDQTAFEKPEKDYSKPSCDCTAPPPCVGVNEVLDKPAVARQINQEPNCECVNAVPDKPLFDKPAVAREINQEPNCECVNAVPDKPLFDKQALARKFMKAIEELRSCQARCADNEVMTCHLRTQLMAEKAAAREQLAAQKLAHELVGRLRSKCEELRDAVGQTKTEYEMALQESEARVASLLSEADARESYYRAMFQEAEARVAAELAQSEARLTASCSHLAEAEARSVAALDEVRARAAAAEEEAQACRRELSDRLHEIQQSKLVAEKMADDLNASERRVAELTDLLQHDKNRIADLTSHISQQEKSHISVQRLMSSKDEELRMASQELDAVRRKSTALDVQLNMLRESVQSMELSQSESREEQCCCACLIKEKVVDDQVETIQQLKKQLADFTCRLQVADESLASMRQRAAELTEDLKVSTERQTQLRNELREQDDCASETEQQSRRLRELERQVEFKQREWSDEMNKMRADKCGALKAAKFATDRLVRTVSELREQTTKCEELRSLMNCTLRQKEMQLEAAHKEIWKSRGCSPSKPSLMPAKYVSHHREIRWMPNKRR